MPVPISARHLTLALGLAAALALSLTSASRAGVPSLYANYVPNCTFSFVNDGGAPVTSVPPGTYQIVVFTPFAFSNGMAACEFVEFHLTGPGVDLDTDLGSGDSESEQHTVTLQPGSTYTVRDDGRPTQTQRTFTVALSGSPGSSTTPTSSSSSTPAKGTPSKDTVGSAVLPFRGALAASVGAIGGLKLVYKGKAVDTLKEGRYRATVTDESKNAGLYLRRLGKRGEVVSSVTLSKVPFVGNRTANLTLKKGQWIFLPSDSGPKRYFIVVG